MNFTFEHTLEEINLILSALAKKPFDEVAGLIGKFHAGAQAQIAAAQAVPTPGAADAPQG